MVQMVLEEIEKWYSEPTNGQERPMLLSKMAVLELCGWLEDEFDDLVRCIDGHCLKDLSWTENMINRTYGFDYNKHLRPMLVNICGEHLMRVAERDFERAFPGELERFKALLGSLWRERCGFAHADLAGNTRRQQNFQAPSWSITQHRSLQRLIGQYRTIIEEKAQTLPM